MKKLIICFSMMLLCSIVGKAENAVYVWTTAAEDTVCYQFSLRPMVQFEGDDAVLLVNNQEVLRLALADDAEIQMVFGEYVETPTSIGQTATGHPKQVGKYIIGGHLYIYRDEHWYDVNGQLIR